MIGRTVSHYKIIEKLGSGGMGIVYKAQDLKLDRFVALKFLPLHLTTSEEVKQRFIHEAKAASSLDHNNICAIHEIDETKPAPGEPGDGQLFIAMAYYEGETLYKRIKEKPIAIDEAIDTAIQIAQGLAKAHEKEIVHRDIKPANIMLTRESVVKVLDFGLAKLSTQTKLTKESITLGTVSYMSPQQAKGEEVDHRTDIWSLGVILYEMLTGQLPFKGEYESAVIYSIINDPQEPVTGLRTGVPMELERIINKCLQKNPGDRYQHVDELIVDLKGMKSGSTGGYPKKEKKKRNPKSILFSVAVLSFLILIVLSYLLILPLEETDKDLTEWDNSIAVLPFADLSPSKDQEYFCDGMTEQIITNLSKIKRLKVIARTSVMTYKNADKQIHQIGKELDVSHILEGSIRKFGDQIRVTAQLVNTEDGSHIWADDFDRKLEHVFEVQDNVSEMIASRLLSTLSIQEITVIKPKKSSNTEAYDLFLKGKYFLHKYERNLQISDIYKSEQMFKRAIEDDPDYAPSYAYLSDVYGTLVYDKPDQKEKYLTLQEKYIQTAYELDSLSADILRNVAFLYWNKGIHDKRFVYLKKSLAIDPNNYRSNLSMGIFLRNNGLPNRAMKFFNKAAELNPVDTWVYVAIATVHTLNGEFDKVEQSYQSALEISSNDYYSLYYYTLFCVRLNQYEKAKELFLNFKKLYPTQKSVKYCESLLFAMQGDSLNALKLFDQSGVHRYNKVELYCLLDFRNKAISLLNDLLPKQKSGRSRFFELSHMPVYNKLRSDPRFQDILAKHKEIYEDNLKKYGDIDI